MENRVCVVCGIGPKNGASLARRFHRAGYRVAMLSRSTQLSASLAEEMGEGAKAYACDVADGESVEAAFKQVVEDLGPVHTLVFNAGSGVWGNIEELSASDFEQAFRVNALGLFQTSQAVIGPMVERGEGAIVVVGATASLRGKPFTTAFAPAKAAQRSLAQAMARHLSPKGVHVSLMILDGRVGAPTGEEINTIDPDHIADAAHFLATQPRSAWTFELDLRPHLESW
ncbi:MAG: SDR family NAD(P)-dependent oxidoreductase [Sandaracinaceae bacterium]